MNSKNCLFDVDGPLWCRNLRWKSNSNNNNNNNNNILQEEIWHVISCFLKFWDFKQETVNWTEDFVLSTGVGYLPPQLTDLHDNSASLRRLKVTGYEAQRMRQTVKIALPDCTSRSVGGIWCWFNGFLIRVSDELLLLFFVKATGLNLYIVVGGTLSRRVYAQWNILALLGLSGETVPLKLSFEHSTRPRVVSTLLESGLDVLVYSDVYGNYLNNQRIMNVHSDV